MKSESKIVSDHQLTELIFQMVKGDNTHKNKSKFDWLTFSYHSWAENQPVEQFINKVNKWLSHGKIPITIISFTPFTDDDNSDTAEWEISIEL